MHSWDAEPRCHFWIFFVFAFLGLLYLFIRKFKMWLVRIVRLFRAGFVQIFVQYRRPHPTGSSCPTTRSRHCDLYALIFTTKATKAAGGFQSLAPDLPGWGGGVGGVVLGCVTKCKRALGRQIVASKTTPRQYPACTASHPHSLDEQYHFRNDVTVRMGRLNHSDFMLSLLVNERKVLDTLNSFSHAPLSGINWISAHNPPVMSLPGFLALCSFFLFCGGGGSLLFRLLYFVVVSLIISSFWMFLLFFLILSSHLIHFFLPPAVRQRIYVKSTVWPDCFLYPVFTRDDKRLDGNTWQITFTRLPVINTVMKRLHVCLCVM